MTRRGADVFLAVVVAMVVLVPSVAFAQEGQIAGTVRDSSNAVMPGVTVEVTSPALIEKVRTAITDANGQYRITNLPVGTYKVVFTLSGFAKQERDDVILSSNFTAPVNATMSVGQLTETVVVAGITPIVDVQNSREVINLQGATIRDLPTSRNANSLLELTPGISSQYRASTSQSPFGAPGVCVGGIGVFCSPNMAGFNVGDTGTAHRPDATSRRVESSSTVRWSTAVERYQSSGRRAGTQPTSPTRRKSTSGCRDRSASRRRAGPRSTSCREPVATGIPAISS